MMRIESIRLENYRCHADLTVQFGPGFNVIVGVNGSGKTSLLGAVCEALMSAKAPAHQWPIRTRKPSVCIALQD
jgi:DNA repair exonuclease SbcCD ATPase subunit